MASLSSQILPIWPCACNTASPADSAVLELWCSRGLNGTFLQIFGCPNHDHFPISFALKTSLALPSETYDSQMACRKCCHQAPIWFRNKCLNFNLQRQKTRFSKKHTESTRWNFGWFRFGSCGNWCDAILRALELWPPLRCSTLANPDVVAATSFLIRGRQGKRQV